MTTYRLPELPYAYNALEPHIDEETMRLHHDKHHQAYVNGANQALERMAQAHESNDPGRVKSIARDLAFNASGHLLHSVFWTIMAPKSETGEVSGLLQEQLRKDFDGVEGFRRLFSAAAAGVEGSGWALLSWERTGERLLVSQLEKHHNLAIQSAEPLLVLDVWEHAYYLKYKNKRADYIENWWQVVNWIAVSERFESAMTPATAAV